MSDPAVIATLITIGAALLGVVIRIVLVAGKILERVKDHSDVLASHGRILTNGLRAEVKDNSVRIAGVEGQLNQINERLGMLPCTGLGRCRPNPIIANGD